MSIAKFKLDEATKLEFGISITGAEGKPTARFIIEGPEHNVGFPCVPLQGGGVEVNLKDLKNMFKAGEYPVRLEVIVENKLFVPFEDTIVLEPNVHVTTKPKAVKEIRENVNVDRVIVKPTLKEDNHKEIAMMIAETLGYSADDSDAPTTIVNEALANRKSLTKSKAEMVQKLLRKAISENLDFDRKLLKPVKN